MEQIRSQRKIAMTFGAYYGLSAAVISMLFYFFNTDVQSKLPQFVGYGLQIAFIIAGIRSYRDNELGGFIKYGRALGTGILISIFGGIIIGATTLILFTWLAPDLPQKILDLTQENLLKEGMAEEQVEMVMGYTRKFMTPGWLFFFSIAGAAFMGFIFSLLISIFMKRDQSNPFKENIG